jgi:NADH:ubiquinone oxidoreductase subunit F (NADH-binding)/NADH:ubiquinone oxidoreductase subunit E
MTTKARAYRATQSPESELSPALPAIQSHCESGVPQDAATLARTVHLPVATLRGAISSFDDSRTAPGALRLCAGTSCVLAGGAGVSRELSRDHACHPVYCLGYCDRSPVAMTPGGKVVPELTRKRLQDLTNEHAIPHPPPPSIRSEARHAIVTARIGRPDWNPDVVPRYVGLEAALRMSPEAVVETLVESGERGRGGAAYPTGLKWKLAAAASGSPKFVVANGDEGDPGSFIDRELMERDPHAIIEGMAICAHAVGASRGIVFIRSEYPVAAAVMGRAVAEAAGAGILGADSLGRGRSFEVEVVRGMGSYVCGEETALLAAIEGQRGEVWPRPPYPVEFGLFGRPTVVDNVETLVNVPWIMEHGAPEYATMGTPESRGTKALCFNHGFARPGIVEVEFGVPLRIAIERFAGGGAGGVELEAVLLGGPMGSILTPEPGGGWDAPICFTGMARRGINLGHAGMVAIPRPADWGAILRHLLTFMRDESCGKCVPCRLGTARGHEMAKRGLSRESLPRFERILDLMKVASLCAFGRETPGPVRTILEKFGDRIFTDGETPP